MPALSPDEERRIRAAAVAKGEDPEQVIAEVKALAADGDAPAGKAAKPAEAPEVFQYHLPYLRTFEVRALVGFDERIDDDTMLCGEFLAKHGGALAGGSGGGSPPPSE